MAVRLSMSAVLRRDRSGMRLGMLAVAALFLGADVLPRGARAYDAIAPSADAPAAGAPAADTLAADTLVVDPSIAAARRHAHAGAPQAGGQTGPASAAPEPSPSGIIDTIAGGGSVRDGGPALAARFNLPGGVTVSPDGDIIIVDFGNHRVRRIDHRTGRIEAVAGTGEAGYNGDGIPATEARLSRPEFALFDPSGNLLIADSYNNRIRRIDRATGLISTVAGTGERGFGGDGGPATAAQLHFPEGIAMDTAGNLFIGDTVNRRIRRVDARTGLIATYAGTGETGTNDEGTPATRAKFLRLARLAVDRAGNVFIADSPSHRILRIDARSRLLRTAAGTGTPGFSGDGGRATDAEISFPEGVIAAPDDSLYFADVGNHRVRRVDGATGIIDTVAGTGEKGFSGDGGAATEARLWSPGRVWLDADGNLLIADILNARVRRVAHGTGRIETIAGTGDWGDNGPGTDALLSVPGDVVYAAGRVYVADYGTRRVRCVDLASGRITTVAGGGTRTGEGIPAREMDFLLPEGIAVDGRRTLYVADNIAGKVWAVDLASGLIRTFAGGGDDDSGRDGPARSARLQLPAAVTVAPDGAVYIADFGGRRLRRVNAKTGLMQTVLGPGRASPGPRLPLDVAATSLDAAREGLFLLLHDSADVHLMDPRSSEFRPVPRIDRLPAPASGDSQVIDVAVHAPFVYLADALAHRVVRINLRASTASIVAGSGAQGFSGDGGAADRASLFQPGGVAVSDDGRELFIADTKNHRIRRVRFADAGGTR